MQKRIGVFGAMLAVAGGFAMAQEATVPLPADTIIAVRQALLDLQAGNVAGMKAAIESGGDVTPFKDAARALSAAGHVIPTLFPDGTETGHGTHALPTIWSDRAGFNKAAENFWTQADRLAVLAEANDKPGFAAQFKETGQACGACHKVYRQKLN